MKNNTKGNLHFLSNWPFSIIGGVVKYSIGYMEDNPDLYIPKEKGITI